ncbi:MAG: phosphocholine cytidylyltransferase family protein [Candidatus Omnitrophica bacterium]|nr:phosphocholine cytidylyltransferase family protein [Candidatus Omnitrophota bacterium]
MLKVILLAAGVGRRFGEETKNLPKCLLPLPGGGTLLGRYFRSFRELGLRDVVIVVGHKKEKIKRASIPYAKILKIRFIENKKYKKGSILSLHAAKNQLNGDCLIMDADVYFPTAALKKLIRSKKKTAFLADPRSKSTGEEMMLQSKNGKVFSISKKPDPLLKPVAEATGLFKISGKDISSLKKILDQLVRQGRTHVEYEEAYAQLLKKTQAGFETLRGFWTEVDFKDDWNKIAVQTLKMYSFPGSRS